MKTETSTEEFIEAIQRLPNHEHKNRWLNWLTDYNNKPGPFGRQVGKNHSAKYVYGQMTYPEMMLWLVQAAGIKEQLVKLAESDCNRVTNMKSKSKAIRDRVPWETLERALCDKSDDQ